MFIEHQIGIRMIPKGACDTEEMVHYFKVKYILKYIKQKQLF